MILSCDRFQNRAFTYSDEMFEEDDEIKESGNPLYSSRFSANYCKILVIAWFSSLLDALEESRIPFSQAETAPTLASTLKVTCHGVKSTEVIRPVHVQFRP